MSMGAASAGTQAIQGVNQLISGVVSFVASRDNAKFLERQAEVVEVEGRRAASRIVSKQRVAFAKAGVDPNVGTARDIQVTDIGEGVLAAKRRAFPLRQEARNERLRGSQALLSGIVGFTSGAIAKPSFAAAGISGSSALGPVQRVARV